MTARKNQRGDGTEGQAGHDMSEPIDTTRSEPAGPTAPAPNDIQAHIGRQLRSLYDGVVQQPVPDRFRELLDKLDAASGEKKEQE